MAAGDKFSRIRSYAGTLFLSAVNTSTSTPGSQLALPSTAVTLSHRHDQRNQMRAESPAAYRLGQRDGFYGSGCFAASLVFSVPFFFSYIHEREYSP